MIAFPSENKIVPKYRNTKYNRSYVFLFLIHNMLGDFSTGVDLP